MISVVLLVYNQALEDVLPSIASVVRQENCEAELVVADDGSDRSIESPVREYLDHRHFARYRYVRSERNRGIVDNLCAGVRAASGEIVKLLSPGDILYSRDTLHKIEMFSRAEGVQIGFGRLRGYRVQDGEIADFPYQAPTHPELYNDFELDNEVLLKSQVLYTDWVPGCALFYQRDFIIGYLHRLHEMGVKYAEDLTCPLITLDGVRIRFFDEYVLWYEVGSGVTTSGNRWATKRLYADHHRFFAALAESPGTPLFRQAARLFAIREFIALRTPFYRLAQNIVKRRYVTMGSSSGSIGMRDREFLHSCRFVEPGAQSGSK